MRQDEVKLIYHSKVNYITLSWNKPQNGPNMRCHSAETFYENVCLTVTRSQQMLQSTQLSLMCCVSKCTYSISILCISGDAQWAVVETDEPCVAPERLRRVTAVGGDALSACRKWISVEKEHLFSWGYFRSTYSMSWAAATLLLK